MEGGRGVMCLMFASGLPVGHFVMEAVLVDRDLEVRFVLLLMSCGEPGRSGS